jgi:gliding motility-associated-like protein
VRQIVVNNYGCKDTDTVHVSNLYRVKIKIPNVFTPDHDDTNDTYQIYAEGLVKGDSDAYHLVIFNEWGERMFETHTQGNGWDGKNFGDRDCPTGTYYYIFFWKPKAWIDLKKDQDYGSQTEVTDVSTTDSNGKKIPRGKATGTITLLRKN